MNTPECFKYLNRYSGKTFEVLGFTADADTYCPDCAQEKYPMGIDSEENELGAIFADSEWDYPVHCNTCREEILVNLTEDGRRAAVDSADIEIFYMSESDIIEREWKENGEYLDSGWYGWHCLPGCLPDCVGFPPIGPCKTESEAYEEAYIYIFAINSTARQDSIA